MDIFAVIENQFGLFLIVLTRISGIFIISPFLGSRNIPMRVRIGVAFAFALILFPTLLPSIQNMVIPETLFGYVYVILLELFVGWAIGFIAYLSFAVIHVAGQLLDLQVGFAMINVLDPTTGQQVPLLGSFQYNLAIIIFLVTNSHYILIKALFESFNMVPLMTVAVNESLLKLVVDMVTMSFNVGIKIALPVLSAIILTDVALGILARTMPQMNIFVVGIPAKIFIGIFVLAFALPFYIMFLDVTFNEMYGNIYVLLRSLQ